MPIERREIRLAEDELMRAIISYGRQTPGVLPPGPVLRVALQHVPDAAPCVTATVLLAADREEPPVDVRLQASNVLEMLVRYCQEEGIPIPRGGQKSTSVIGGMLTLVIDSPRRET